MTDNANIILGDVLEWAATYDGEPFHALLADPPYELGFMGRKWDSTGIAFQPETWAAISQHLLPGAFLMTFAGSRGWHRQAVAMEDAGLIMHPSVFLLWAYGSGFPKATRIDAAIDKAAGHERGRLPAQSCKQSSTAIHSSGFGKDGFRQIDNMPVSDEAKAWVGHRYGKQALKPAAEPILVFQKPYEGKPLDCIKRTGAGALNIGAGRIGKESTITRNTAGVDKFAHKFSGARVPRCGDYENPEGRWPANLALDEIGAGIVDGQSGVSVSSGGITSRDTAFLQGVQRNGDTMQMTGNRGGLGDSGGASRFFASTDWHAEVLEQLDECDRAFYVSKAGRAERDAGLEAFVLRDATNDDNAFHAKPGRARTPQSAIGGARERIERGDTPVIARANNHPTVKPLRLNKWLASLLLPPAEYGPRRLLNPFCGSGSEACGALLAGWDEIVAIEREAEYHAIAEARVKFWSGNVGLFEALTAGTDEEPPHPTLDLAG